MANDLEPYENVTRVFWIKIELNDHQKAGRQAFGEIKDVKSGERGSIYDPYDIICFILPYLKKMGIKIHWFWRFMSWRCCRSKVN